MNLESAFLSITDKSHFPSNKDCVANYRLISEYFILNIHPEMKTKMLEYEKDGYYNNHGIEHVNMVINRISTIIEHFSQLDKSFKLDNYEQYILLIAAHLHDSGHLIGTREEHTKKAKSILTKFFGNQIESTERILIASVVEAHSGKKDPIARLQPEDFFSSIKVRPQLLAAILRLADELAEDKQRASRGLLYLEDKKGDDSDEKFINVYSEIYHRFSECVDSIHLHGNEIHLKLCVNEKQLVKLFSKIDKGAVTEHYLLDEIYERTYKTFTETLYCNRFFPAQARFSSVKVKIYLLTNDDELIIDPLSYVLEESGYPMTSGISALIHDKVKKDDTEINGAYIANLLSK